MSPRHFARMNQSPKQRQEEHEGLANVFTSFTSLIGLGKYFSQSPAVAISNNPIEDPAKAGDQKTNHSNLYR
jgi:hypothetical protein